MTIVKKESIVFSEKEKEALDMVLKICNGLAGEASDPNIIQLARKTYDDVATICGYEEDGESK